MRIIYIFVFCFFTFHIFADNIDYLSLSSGCFDFMRKNNRSAEVRVEYKPSFNMQTIRPLFGATVTFKGSVYLYSGLSFDLFFNRNLYFSPNFAAGLYYAGRGKDLNYPLEISLSSYVQKMGSWLEF